MGVRIRSTKNGKNAEYHYSFMQSGKRYWGVCEGCLTKAAALAYEKKIRDTTRTLSEQKSVGALVENFKRELTGGDVVALADAYERSLKKPRRRQPSEELIRTKRAYWMDFVAFMQKKYPDTVSLDMVNTIQAEDYIQYLRLNGRFCKLVSYGTHANTRRREYLQRSNLSAKTVNTYQQVLAEVFSLLAVDAGIINNPFSSIPKLKNDPENREAFSEKELKLIRDNADDFILPLFMIAVATALREGDICTLKWDDIHFDDDVIIKKMNKTKNFVEIPIIPPLREYLLDLKEKPTQDCDFACYVLPSHAKMYMQNASGISYRIKYFLEQKCGIKTTRIPEGRSRAVSVKDLHSCRHTFCYYAGVYGIPLNVVQGIVGHMTQEMTKHYSAHASIEIKREKMKQLPSFMVLCPSKRLLAPDSDVTALRRTLKEKIDSMSRMQLEAVSSILERTITQNSGATLSQSHGSVETSEGNDE